MLAVLFCQTPALRLSAEGNARARREYSARVTAIEPPASLKVRLLGNGDPTLAEGPGCIPGKSHATFQRIRRIWGEVVRISVCFT